MTTTSQIGTNNAMHAEHKVFRFTIKVWNGDMWVEFATCHRATHAALIERMLWKEGCRPMEVQVKSEEVNF